MLALFHSFIYQPLYNVVIFLYNVVPGHDFGIAIIITTLLLRTLLIPFSKKQIESQKKLQELQPKLKEIQAKYKDNKERQTKEIMEFYRTNKTNPFGGCLPLVVQFIFLIAIYRILFNISSAGLNANPADLYSFVINPGQINNFFLGFINLTKPNVIFAIIAALAQFVQTKMMMGKMSVLPQKNAATDGKPDITQMMNKQMLFLGPIITLIIGIKFNAGLSLYWIITTLFSIVQQRFVMKKNNH